jgi:hypothetical protein
LDSVWGLVMRTQTIFELEASLPRAARTQGLYRDRDYSGLTHYTKVHTFRLSTLIVGWSLLIGAFIFYPKFIAQSPRSLSHGIETLADALPDQISSYVEIGLDTSHQ